MSQNDFTIANQTFPNTRADINSALQALASTSSGSSAPSTTFANQFFYNTTSNLLQIRNEANDAFITIAELDQTNDTVEYFKSDSVRTALIEFTDGDDALAIADGGALTVSTSLDMNGTELILDADADTSIHASTDDQIDVKIGGADKVVLTSSLTQFNQNVCVDAFNAVGAGGGIFFRGGFINVNQPSITVRTHNADSAPDGLSVNGNDGITFRVASADRGSFSEGGQFLIGTTAFNTGVGHSFHQDGYAYLRRASGSAQSMIIFNVAGSDVGEIRSSTSATAYLTSSDYRLKENVSYTFDATARLKQLKPARFNFKTDADTTVDGFLAHEVSSIVPEAISGTKDGTKDLGTIKDADGKVLRENVIEAEKKDGQTWEKTSTENDYQGIDQSKLVPLLVKTIQELEARITALES